MDKEREQWLIGRQSGIGGSNAPVLLGIESFRTLYDLWKSKVEEITEEESVSQDIKRGNALEPIVAEMLSAKTGYRATMGFHGQHGIPTGHKNQN